LLVNCRAHIIENILKDIKFDKKYQNTWYPYTWHKYNEENLKDKQSKKIANPFE